MIRAEQVEKVVRQGVVVIREYEAEKDLAAAEAVDRMCEVGTSGAVSLFTDLLGDPVCRIRHSPAFLMLVVETTEPAKEMVGLVRGCIKTITCGKKNLRPTVAAVSAAVIEEDARETSSEAGRC